MFRRALLLLSILMLVWNSLYFTPYVVDDAFISFRYARNLVAGHGLVFNPGERVEGFSNFSWVMLEAGLLALGLPILAGVKAVGLASAIAVVLCTYGLGRVLWPASTAKALVATAGVALSTNLAVWSQAGLESAFFAALIVGMCLRFELERRHEGARPWSALLFAAAWLTRPEAPIYGLYFLARRFGARDRTPLGRFDRAWAALFLVVVVPYEVFGLTYFGGLVPNTHAAKIGRDASLFERALGDSQLVHFVTEQGWGLPGLLLLGLVGCLLTVRRVPAAAWAPTLGGVVFLLYAWNDWMPRFRFFVPFLPALFLCIAHGGVELATSTRLPRAARLACGALLALFLLGYAQQELFGAYYRTRERDGYRFATEARGAWFLDVPASLRRRTLWPLESVAQRLLELTPEKETVAIADIGLPGYLCMNPVWDLRGLVTPSAAAFDDDRPDATAAAVRDLLERRPVLVLLPGQRGDELTPRMDAFDRALRADPVGGRAYQRLESETGGGVLYLRKNRPRQIPAGRTRRALERFPEYEPPR